MTQLVEQSLPIPEVNGSNPVIGKLLNMEHLFTANCIKKTKINIKRPGMAHVIKNKHLTRYSGFIPPF